MRLFFLALSFLTAIPVKGSLMPPEPNLSRCAPFFPVVGLLLGLFLGGLAYGGLLIFPPGPLIVFIFIMEFLLTRGFHLDGLADTVDGLAASAGPKRALEIMRDGAVGPMGTSALFLFFLFKYAALGSLERSMLVPAIIFLPVAGRWSLVLAGAAAVSARRAGLGYSFITALGWKEAAISTLIPGGLLIPLYLIRPALFLPLLTGITAAALLSFLFIRATSRFLGGATGDVLGAAALVAEIGFLVGILAA